MAKFLVTMTTYQTLVVEADSEEEASFIANEQSDDDDWDDPFVDWDLLVEPYDGHREAFNQKEESK